MKKEDLVNEIRIARKKQKDYNLNISKNIDELNAGIKRLEDEEEEMAKKREQVTIIYYDPETVVEDLSKMLRSAGISPRYSPRSHRKEDWNAYRKIIARNLIQKLSKQ